jgi:hypothetical protein
LQNKKQQHQKKMTNTGKTIHIQYPETLLEKYSFLKISKTYSFFNYFILLQLSEFTCNQFNCEHRNSVTGTGSRIGIRDSRFELTIFHRKTDIEALCKILLDQFPPKL